VSQALQQLDDVRDRVGEQRVVEQVMNRENRAWCDSR
jgi:hypothetical protein